MQNHPVVFVDDKRKLDIHRIDALFKDEITIVSPNVNTTKCDVPIMNFTLSPYNNISWDFRTIIGPKPMSRAKKLKARAQRKKMKMHKRRRG